MSPLFPHLGDPHAPLIPGTLFLLIKEGYGGPIQ